MDFSRCKELVALADKLNFSKAAEELFVTQSTLSKHVASAEREVGFRIFERNTVRVELTESGSAFIKEAREAIAHYEAGVSEGLAACCSVETTIRIIGPLMNPTAIALVSASLARFSSMPNGCGTKISIVDTGVRDCCEKILDEQADIAIAFRYKNDPDGLLYKHLFTIPFGIACHSSNPLASKSPLRFRDLANSHIVTYPEEGRRRYHEFVETVCSKHSIHPDVSKTDEGFCLINSKDDIIFGVFYPDYTRFGPDFVARKLDDISDEFEVCVVIRKNESRDAVLDLFACFESHRDTKRTVSASDKNPQTPSTGDQHK
ncbi:MAG: LysR family transcriptional regulator [Slackia sp.]|nr:LysR family transcriptional regulator [Slackia sp.]